ncbi:MAG TPA: hypothetical protein PKC72_06730 [Chitinophagaceae bacterium]|nr:hypothetical protein [Chitinophagaceae bacterium]
MKKEIQTYNDLLKYEQTLDELLDAQKELLKADFEELSTAIKPTISTLNLFGKIVMPVRENPLLNFGTNRVLDFALRTLMPKRSGWLAKLFIPYFLRNYLSHFVADQKENIKEKLFSSFSHHNGTENKPAGA